MRTEQIGKKQAWVVYDADIKGVRYNDYCEVNSYFQHQFPQSGRTIKDEVEYLMSYESIVAAYNLSQHVIYLFPRYRFSPTTSRHVTLFLSRYFDEPISMGEIQYCLKKNICLHGINIIMCDGFYNKYGEFVRW